MNIRFRYGNLMLVDGSLMSVDDVSPEQFGENLKSARGYIISAMDRHAEKYPKADRCAVWVLGLVQSESQLLTPEAFTLYQTTSNYSFGSDSDQYQARFHPYFNAVRECELTPSAGLLTTEFPGLALKVTN